MYLFLLVSIDKIGLLKHVIFFFTQTFMVCASPLHMFSKVQKWTPFSKFLKLIFAELPQKKYLMKRHIHS